MTPSCLICISLGFLVNILCSPVTIVFLGGDRDFYVEAIRKLLKAFPLDSPLLQDLDALDPASRLDLSPETG